MKMIKFRDNLKKNIKSTVIEVCTQHGIDPSDIKYELKVDVVVNVTNNLETNDKTINISEKGNYDG